MTKVELATQKLEKSQGALDKLTSERDFLTGQIMALKEARSAMVRALASGDETQRKGILDLEAQLAPLLLRQEGLSGLIGDAENEVSKATDVLDREKAGEREAVTAFVQQRTQAEREALVAGLEPRVDRIYELHKALSLELGNLEVEAWKFWKGKENPLWDVLRRLHRRIAEKQIAEGFRGLRFTRLIAPLEVYPLVNSYAEVLAGNGDLKADEVAIIEENKMHAAAIKEFNEGEN